VIQEHEDDQRELDRTFEVGKHLSTLSATALVLVFAAQGLDVVAVNILWATVLFGTALLAALVCVNIGTVVRSVGAEGHERHERHVQFEWVQLGVATALFFFGVLFVFVWRHTRRPRLLWSSKRGRGLGTGGRIAPALMVQGRGRG